MLRHVIYLAIFALTIGVVSLGMYGASLWDSAIVSDVTGTDLAETIVGRENRSQVTRQVMPRNGQEDEGETVSHDDLQLAITLAGEYLVNVNRPDGQFVYRQYLEPRNEPKRKYNMLRHAGTLYALARYFRWQPKHATWDVLMRGNRFMRQAIRSLPAHPEKYALWSEASVTGQRGPTVAKLGGTGLALVAMASIHQIDARVVSLQEMQRLARFLCYMQKPNGSFHSKYIPTNQGRSDNFVSLYYPGEATLGLIMLYQMDSNPKWLQAAIQSLTYLAQKRRGQKRLEADHWSLLATAELMKCGNIPDGPGELGPDGLFIDHAVRICRSILSCQPRLLPGTSEYGGFVKDGRTCPTATRLEGLIACRTWLPESDFHPEARWERAVLQGIRFVLRSQIKSGRLLGGIPRAIKRWPEGNLNFDPSFNRRVGEVRIDYVQHALSALISYHEYIYCDNCQRDVASYEWPAKIESTLDL